MARQDIYAELSDDVLNKAVHTSSQRGKVKCIDVLINTDVAGFSALKFCFDKDNKNVIVTGNMPKKWGKNIRLTDVV
jgi:hypothetical protein